MKKWVKILLLSVLGLVLLAGLAIGFLYYRFEGKYPEDSTKYPHDIGYLSSENIDFSENFKRCSEKLPVGFYHSAAPQIYKGGKSTFRKFILSNLENSNYSDTGILNLRFLINCNGDIGDMEINELDFDFQKINLNDALVDTLIDLTVNKENWISIETDGPRDTYMYLIYRIENGEIVEILP